VLEGSENMSEEKVIRNTMILNTRESLGADFKKIGIKKGMILLVHASLSAIGWVSGGPVAVIQALMDVVTPEGTIVMPAHSGDYSDPIYWENPAVPRDWIEAIKESMPAYEPEITPTRGIGIIPEIFRTFPEVIRSVHPSLSFTAWGKYSSEITKGHELDYSLGEKSPLARVYDLDGHVLLLGVGYDKNTSFHLSEYRKSGTTPFIAGAPIIKNGVRVWQEYDDIEFDTEMFKELGEAFERKKSVNISCIGVEESRLFKQRDAVDFGQKWLEAKKEF
jgi:aminoglycoside 3-N-acetyltransferase